ncbi:hypothetical protein F5Y04DRAFT_285552 [Hypomontagnella monticulosa]|nr:hypothetical protein F5Y04DRAFT_285552 [Hypomontagnella monticulosa]
MAALGNNKAAFGDRLNELTTVFTPPCPTTWLLTTSKIPSQYPPFPTTGPTSCDPPSWVDNISQKGFAFYSPAICPSGFSIGCTIGNDRTREGFPPVTSGETAMYCIPSGYTCTSDTTDFRGGVWGFSTRTSKSGPIATVGPAIQVRWREVDLSSLETNPMNSGERPPDVTASTPENNLLDKSTTVLSSEILDPDPLATSVPASLTSSFISTSNIVPQPTSSEGSGFNVVSPPGQSNNQFAGKTEASIQTDTATDSQANPTSTAAAGSNPSSSDNEATVPNTASSTSMAAMALSGILIVMILGYLTVASIRRYRRYRLGKVKTLLPFRLRPFTQKWKWDAVLPSHRTIPGPRPSKNPDAELGTDGPLPELGPGDPLGTKENPAELAGNVVRNSWVSQVSRIFTTRLKKDIGPV